MGSWEKAGVLAAIVSALAAILTVFQANPAIAIRENEAIGPAAEATAGAVGDLPAPVSTAAQSRIGDGTGSLPGRASRPLGARSPSFACNKATTWTEHVVCSGNARLAELDTALDRAYVHNMHTLSNPAQARMRWEQKNWLAGLGSCRHAEDGAACLIDRYEARLNEIEDRASDDGSASPAPAESDGVIDVSERS